ncbi:MAG TPA: AmmeMemoRadiSam system protein B [Pseudomonadales bacterium]
MTTRTAAVAGMFYPGEPDRLAATVRQLLADSEPAPAAHPKALIVPHAGYVYSGPIAASAYRQLDGVAERISRVVLLGPAHRVPLIGMAFPSVDSFAVPGGDVPLDRAAIAAALELPGTCVSDEAHAFEHCLEVQLPFLQAVLGSFQLVPMVVGRASAMEVARVLECLWGGDETLIVVSSDLSHYLPYDHARRVDAHTTAKILARATDLTGEEACGAYAINGLLLAARGYGLSVHSLDVRNSGDTAGDRRQVVGYGSYALD